MNPDAEDRGISFPLTYVLTLGITTIVVTGLLVSASGVVDRERDRAIRQELRTIGADVVADLAAVDRLVEGTDDTTVTLRVSLPRRVSGDPYVLALEPAGACGKRGQSIACLDLRASGTGIGETVPFRNGTPVENGSATGGEAAIVYRNGTLTITDRP